MKEKIIQYEQRLLEDRKKLLELVKECENSNSGEFDETIEQFKLELKYMERRLNILKQQCTVSESGFTEQLTPEAVVTSTVDSASVLAGQLMPEAVVTSTVDSVSDLTGQLTPEAPAVSDMTSEGYETTENCHMAEDTETTESRYKAENTKKTWQTEKSEAVRERKSIEQTIGKSFMGIMASVLIFISFILFATLVLPYLGDGIKVAAMYAVSFAFTGVGLYKQSKDKSNSFYTAITGCGVGAVYLSLFLTNVYFKMINDIVLYILIAVWAVFVCWLSKNKNSVFQIIGQTGISIAVIFGSALCVADEDIHKLIAVTGFYFVTFNVFYVAHFEKNLSGNIKHHIFNIVNCVAIYEGSTVLNSMREQPHPLNIFMLVLVIVHMAVIYKNIWSSRSISYGIIIAGYTILTGIFAAEVTGVYVVDIFMYLFAAAIVIASELKLRDKSPGKLIIHLVTIIIMFASAAGLCEKIYMAMLATVLPFVVLGFVFNSKIYKYGSVLVFCMYVLLSDRMHAMENVFTGLMLLAAMYVFIYRKKEQYSRRFKKSVYLAALLFITYDIRALAGGMSDNRELVELLVYIIALGYNIAVKMLCSTNPQSGEKERTGLYDFINIIMMGAGLEYISLFDETMTHLFMIMAVLVAFSLNVKRILDRNTGILAGIYVGLKYTVLMVTILDSFDTVNYVISICCFIFAIISITAGFVTGYMSLRVYGIVLSMISVFKLLMVDITYENTLGNALSFFISGMLCFAISMIYNYVDKKYFKGKEE